MNNKNIMVNLTRKFDVLLTKLTEKNAVIGYFFALNSVHDTIYYHFPILRFLKPHHV